MDTKTKLPKACTSGAGLKHRGYSGQGEWLEWMSKRYIQHQCPKCKLWHVWHRKLSGTKENTEVRAKA